MKSISELKDTVHRPEKVLQFGEGVFLRAFVDWQIDIANQKTDFNGNVVIIKPLPSQGIVDTINNQKGLYTAVLRGIQKGKKISQTHLVNSVSRCINCYSDYASYIELAKNKDIKFIVSNTTEAGIVYSEGCNFSDEPPTSFPAKVCQFLYKRYEVFSASRDAGIVFIPCELIDCNGDALRNIVLRYAAEWNLGEKFTGWVNESCTFCNSLVDRIVTGFPDEDADEIFKELGYEDKLLDAAEIFYLWVIESKKNIEELKKIFPLQAAGLNVVWTDDLSFYRTRKVCILNGAHTMFVPAGFLYGFDTVRECIEDGTMLKFIRKGIFEEIIPVMNCDKKMLQEYAEDVLERFANPFIKHLLINIALNSTSKFKVRDLPSLLSYIEKFGKAPKILSFSMAALITFYEGNERSGRILKSANLHNGEHYNISDNEEAVIFFENLYSETNESHELAERVLANENFWGADLTKYNCLVESVADCILSIQKNGMKKAVALVVED